MSLPPRNRASSGATAEYGRFDWAEPCLLRCSIGGGGRVHEFLESVHDRAHRPSKVLVTVSEQYCPRTYSVKFHSVTLVFGSRTSIRSWPRAGSFSPVSVRTQLISKIRSASAGDDTRSYLLQSFTAAWNWLYGRSGPPLNAVVSTTASRLSPPAFEMNTLWPALICGRHGGRR